MSCAKQRGRAIQIPAVKHSLPFLMQSFVGTKDCKSYPQVDKVSLDKEIFATRMIGRAKYQAIKETYVQYLRYLTKKYQYAIMHEEKTV